MLHFAYGSNMSRTLMGARCKGAEALGVATLPGWRVHGVLWRLTARDLAAINAYESIDSGLYRRRRLSVRCGARQAAALVYIASQRGEGRARPGYINVVVAAARDWGLPAPYIRSLARWSSSRWAGARARD